MSSSWKTPTRHGECPESDETFDEVTVQATKAAKAQDTQAYGALLHEPGSVVVCGCVEGLRTALAKLMKAHQAECDYEPVGLFDAAGGSG